MTTDNFLEYNCLDSACMVEIHNSIWPDLSQGYEPAYNMTIDLLEPLAFMQTRGIKMNREAMEVTKASILRSANEKQEELNKIVGREINVNSPKEMQSYFYVELGIPPYYNEGSVTVDDLALQRLTRGTAKHPGLRQAKLVQEVRGLQKLYSTYLNIEFDKDDRFRCSYNPRGTKFGRLSSSKTIFGTGGNAQNLPQEFKAFLVADPGYALVEVDKRQAEWVAVAYISGDANMLSAVESGRDIHIHTASLMFDSDPEVIKLESKLVGYNSDPDVISQIREESGFGKFMRSFPRTMSARQCGKKSNHGLNYDEGPNKFALINEIEIPEAKRIHKIYHNMYPGIRLWYENVKRQLQKDRTLTNCFGRKVRFMDAWGTELWKSAYSFLPQSSVVDSLNIGLVKLYHDADLCAPLPRGVDIDVLAQVHDSILMQVPIPVLSDAYSWPVLHHRIFDYVSPDLNYNGRTFRIATDMKMGLNWGGYSKTNLQGMQEVKNMTDITATLRSMTSEQGVQ